LAEGVDPWRELLALARDEAVPGRVRKSAVFWVGQAVSERATLGLSELVEDDDVDLDARETAVFALSQRPDAEAVPALIDIARSSGSGSRAIRGRWSGSSRCCCGTTEPGGTAGDARRAGFATSVRVRA